MRMVRTTGKDDNGIKDNDREDDGDNGKDARTTTTARTMTATTTATTARTTAMMAATATALAMAVARLVGMSVARSVAWLVAVFFAWRLHTIGIVQTCFGINLFWSKLVKIIFGTSGQVQYNLFYLYVLLFQVYSMFIPV